MFKVLVRLTEIRDELRIANKLLAKIAGATEEELLSINVERVDFSDAVVLNPPTEEELLLEEDESLERRISARFSDRNVRDRNQFYDEDAIGDLANEVNEE